MAHTAIKPETGNEMGASSTSMFRDKIKIKKEKKGRVNSNRSGSEIIDNLIIDLTNNDDV